MDISYKINNQKFNYRVAAIIIKDHYLLVMNDERNSYYYLPGGRVKMMESSDQAIIRELKEELKIEPKIIRPLWMNQSFFNEDVSKVDYHELCIYYLIDGSEFSLNDFMIQVENHEFKFKWIKVNELKDQYFYPTFLKEAILALPSTFTMMFEYE